MKISIGVTDDHHLFLKALVKLMGSYPSLEVMVEASNGQELLARLAALPGPPDLMLIDVDMPVMDGVTTARNVATLYPSVRMVALTMKDDDTTIIEMIRAGCCAYLLKDTQPEELETALLEVYQKGYYNSDVFNLNYRRLVMQTQAPSDKPLTEQERRFLDLACSDRTYKQIAAEMNLSERTIDGYRESLFGKLQVQSRVGMALEAVRRNLVKL